MQATTMKRLICLDFDGVLCDSVIETGVSGWKTGCRIWPEWNTAEPPETALRTFRRLRPLLHTGFESVLLMRIAVEQPDIAIPTEPEIQSLYDEILAASSMSKQELISVFGKTRDEWINTDTEDWLSRQRLYPGIAQTMKTVLAHALDCIHIVTTKQERFVRELLKAEGITLADNHIHGLESGTKKEVILQTLSEANPQATNHFIVEDRLPTLQKIAATPELDRFTLLYADWGYGHPNDAAIIAGQNRIRVVSLNDFIALLTTHTS